MVSKGIRVRGYVANDAVGEALLRRGGGSFQCTKDNNGKLGAALGTMSTSSLQGLTVTARILIIVGLRVIQGSPRYRLSSSYCASAQLTPGIADVRNTYFAQVPTVVPLHFLFCAEVRARLSKSAEGKTYLLAATKTLLDHFGWRDKAEIGPMWNKLSFMVSGEGRITSDMVPYQEGVQRNAGGALTYRPSKNVRFDVTGEKGPERDPVRGQGQSHMGTITIKRWGKASNLRSVVFHKKRKHKNSFPIDRGSSNPLN